MSWNEGICRKPSGEIQKIQGSISWRKKKIPIYNPHLSSDTSHLQLDFLSISHRTFQDGYSWRRIRIPAISVTWYNVKVMQSSAHHKIKFQRKRDPVMCWFEAGAVTGYQFQLHWRSHLIIRKLKMLSHHRPKIVYHIRWPLEGILINVFLNAFYMYWCAVITKRYWQKCWEILISSTSWVS